MQPLVIMTEGNLFTASKILGQECVSLLKKK